ncbi:HAD family hydrolase [Desertivirga arenae]|uniref:HAD family hydrolase n=1 Tax=Desertivirga arenae TaxID=2810309 RepID=UPI001A97C1AF|nr:HAD hydrolase-like protein [Pedobacter sp. SYSU D00823]
MLKPDSLIFDMDGTLWDALDLYVESWNSGLRAEGVERSVSPELLSSLMGKDSSIVLNAILPEYSSEEQYRIYGTINKHRADLVSTKGGSMYEGVVDGIKQLSQKYKLFIVSNCPEGMIILFMQWAKISEYITDEMAYGVNNMPKHHNIQLLIDKYDLKTPVYIGDTEGDQQESELAGVPFVFFSFGFGKVEKYDLRFDDFKTFTDHFMNL